MVAGIEPGKLVGSPVDPGPISGGLGAMIGTPCTVSPDEKEFGPVSGAAPCWDANFCRNVAASSYSFNSST